eukprot:1564078-Rhodomonas_salina.1
MPCFLKRRLFCDTTDRSCPRTLPKTVPPFQYHGTFRGCPESYRLCSTTVHLRTDHKCTAPQVPGYAVGLRARSAKRVPVQNVGCKSGTGTAR